MKPHIIAVFGITLLADLLAPALVHAQSMRAAIIGGARDGGACTVQVSVDGAAQVEINGDAGFLRTLSGQPAAWQRFQCSAPLPNIPGELWLSNIRGRGTIRLIEGPRGGGGRAVIRIDDPQGGRATYGFEVSWRGHPGRWGEPGGYFPSQAIQGCKDAVADRLYRDGDQYLTFDQVIPTNNSSRNDWVTGLVTGKRGPMNRRFSFSCSVDLASGRVRSVDVRNR